MLNRYFQNKFCTFYGGRFGSRDYAGWWWTRRAAQILAVFSRLGHRGRSESFGWGNERPDEMYECLQTQGHLESNNNDNKKWDGKIHLAKAVEGTITCLSLCARERRKNRGREGGRERINAAAVRKYVFSRVGKEGEMEARDWTEMGTELLETLKTGVWKEEETTVRSIA